VRTAKKPLEPPTCRKDLFWGGRVRRKYQDRIWELAYEVSIDRGRRYSGGMVSSSETNTARFLDGGVSDTRGYFDASCGMWMGGREATAYILWKLGADPRQILGDETIPTLRTLQRHLRKQRQAAEAAT